MEASMIQPAREELIRALADEARVPMEIVSRMYEETWTDFSDGARILDYLPVLVARRVRENLRTMHKDAH
jgi:hypothetical protein